MTDVGIETIGWTIFGVVTVLAIAIVRVAHWKYKKNWEKGE